jgi:hypothetical protein
MATLSDLKAFFQRHHRASLAEIAVSIGVSTDTARMLVNHWIAKNRVRQVLAEVCESKCKSCSCGLDGMEVYEWVGGTVLASRPEHYQGTAPSFCAHDRI